MLVRQLFPIFFHFTIPVFILLLNLGILLFQLNTRNKMAAPVTTIETVTITRPLKVRKKTCDIILLSLLFWPLFILSTNLMYFFFGGKKKACFLIISLFFMLFGNYIFFYCRGIRSMGRGSNVNVVNLLMGYIFQW